MRGGERRHDQLFDAQARVVVVATGAYDRQLPFPGWDLPGVMSGGAAQSLVKSSGVLPGSRIVVAGTGPFLLAVSCTLLEAGADVRAVVEANGPERLLLRAPALLGAWRRGGDLARYTATLARHRVPYLRRQRVIAAEGDGTVERVVLVPVDGDWNAVDGRERVIECDALAVGYGFSVQHELLGQLGCELHTGVDGALSAVVDRGQRTTVRGVLACGETTGVGGADLALAEGVVAGASAAQAVGRTPDARTVDLPAARRHVRRLRRAQDALHAAFPVKTGWIQDLRDDTTLCRCEEMTVSDIRRAIDELGARDARTVKLLARAGMGWCQGRMCGFAVEQLCSPGAPPMLQPGTRGDRWPPP